LARPFDPEHYAYIVGYPQGDVRPNNNITRAEVATVFFRLLSNDIKSAYWTQSNPYTDVSSTNWFNSSVSVMNSINILKGYSDGTFKPNSTITRGELAAVAARFAREMEGVSTSDNGLSFSDISGHWAEGDIMFAAQVGWIRGYADGTFKPNEPITRAEFVTLANRMLGRVPKSMSDIDQDWAKLWPDNTNREAWFYTDIQEASNSHAYDYYFGDYVLGLDFEYERWTGFLATPDWVSIDRIAANTGVWTYQEPISWQIGERVPDEEPPEPEDD
jgi:hypothetical protein